MEEVLMAAGVDVHSVNAKCESLFDLIRPHFPPLLYPPTEAANARAFVERLPEAYDTKVWIRCGTCPSDSPGNRA